MVGRLQRVPALSLRTLLHGHRSSALPCDLPRPCRCRTPADIAAANDVDISKLRDPQPDSARAKDPNVSRRQCLLSAVGLLYAALQPCALCRVPMRLHGRRSAGPSGLTSMQGHCLLPAFRPYCSTVSYSHPLPLAP